VAILQPSQVNGGHHAHPTPENKRTAMDAPAEFAADLLLDKSERRVVSLKLVENKLVHP
jgi:hypothetical protein